MHIDRLIMTLFAKMAAQKWFIESTDFSSRVRAVSRDHDAGLACVPRVAYRVCVRGRGRRVDTSRGLRGRAGEPEKPRNDHLRRDAPPRFVI